MEEFRKWSSRRTVGLLQSRDVLKGTAVKKKGENVYDS